MNFMTWAGVTSLFPHATFQDGISLCVVPEDTWVESELTTHVSWGFKICDTVDMRCEEARNFFPMARHVGDQYTWHMALPGCRLGRGKLCGSLAFVEANSWEMFWMRKEGVAAVFGGPRIRFSILKSETLAFSYAYSQFMHRHYFGREVFTRLRQDLQAISDALLIVDEDGDGSEDDEG
jgi:hypothetical protein